MKLKIYIITLFLAVSSLTMITAQVPTAERDALIALYNATDGTNWTNSTNWSTTEPVETWYGVTVENGNVTALRLNNNNLAGTIPNSIDQLSFLNILLLNFNSISGTIPAQLGLLPNLAILDLTTNQLSGSIPVEFGQLSSIRSISIQNNQLSGSLPTQLGQLTTLTNLNLFNNQLSGSIPLELGNLSSLTTLNLISNQLTGSIPSSLGNLTNLRSLFLSGNNLSGSIPSELNGLINLTDLYLDSNQFTGTIPQELSAINSLTFVYLQNNQLLGNLPSGLLTVQGSVLNVENNRFKFSDLEAEFVAYQNITQTFDYSPQSKVDLEETVNVNEGQPYTMSVSLTNTNNNYQWYKDGVAINGATGKDYTIANATTSDAGVYHVTATNSIVSGLTLERNPINLTITADSCGVSQAEKDALIAIYNATGGPSWTNNTNWNTSAPVCDWYGVTVTNGNVTAIFLGGNNLVGALPPEIGNFPNLTTLFLSTNQITSFPNEIGSLTLLVECYLNNNNLTSIPPGIQTLDSVETLNLSSNQITTIPPELGEMASLKNLNLQLNQLSGSIPSELGNLSSLERLNLWDNQLTGVIPASLGNLINLTNLSLFNNNLTGSIPIELGNLSNAKQINLENNQLTGDIPSSLGNLLNLNNLKLSNNQLQGIIPPELGNLQSIHTLEIGSNQLTGAIPSTFGNLKNLYRLDLTSNQLSGPIPPELGDSTILNRIFLGNNLLSGNIPPELGNLNNLTILNLSNNQLTGSIPAEIFNSQFINDLILSVNQLSGDLPSFTGSLASIVISSNNFQFSNIENEFLNYQANISGFTYSPQSKIDRGETINATEGQQQILTTSLSSPNNSYQWYKDGVAIAGATDKDYTIPSVSQADAGIYHATATNSIVTGLILERNAITLTVTAGNSCILESKRDALIALYNATDGPNWTNNTNWNTSAPVCEWYGVNVFTEDFIYLSLASNNLTGIIPPEIGQLTELTGLLLSSNNLSGNIPSEIGNLTNLSQLYLWGNQLTGNIPPEIGNLSNLSTLYLYNNLLTGSIPPELGNLVSVTSFNLSNNQLSGSIPPELGNLTGVVTLNLYRNNLTGTIPLELSNLNSLSTLWLGSNQLTGNIPNWIGSLTNLYNLNLSYNQLTGSIPSELGNIGLRWLYLNSNNLTGNLPNELGNLSSLEVLHLSTNQLDGTIPTSLGNLNSLNDLNLYGNQLSGTIPIELGNLTSVTKLGLGNNELTGEIPPEIGNLTTLTSLDLSLNQLTGSIPPEIGNLINLNFLTIQDNQFTSLPIEIGNLVNLTRLYISNNQLSELPSSFGNLINLEPILNLTNNLLVTLPPEIGNLQTITTLYLQDNKLTSIPTEVGNMNLVNLFLYNNQLTSIPNEINNLNGATVIVNGNMLSGTLQDFSNLNVLMINYNDYTFIDLETNFLANNTGINSFIISPQNAIDNEEIVEVNEGDSYTMSIGLTSTNNSYQWYKDGIEIPGATGREYIISNVTLADAGAYYATASNSIVTGLTLRRAVITLNVNEACVEQTRIIGVSSQPCINAALDFLFIRSVNIQDESYLWTFYDADGTTILGTSNKENPIFTYASVGDYLVTLEITHLTGCITSSRTFTVEDCVIEPEPVACDNCNSFKPKPGRTYVISGWVKENREILCSSGSINSLAPNTDGRITVNLDLEGTSSYLNIQQSIDQINWTTFTTIGAQDSYNINPISNGLIYVRFNSEYCEEYSEVATIDFRPIVASITGPSKIFLNNTIPVFQFGVTGSESPISSWSIDFGDGSPILTGDINTPFPASETHFYQGVGDYVVRFNVTNEAGFSDEALLRVRVIDEEPFLFVLLTGELTAEPGTTVYVQSQVEGIAQFDGAILDIVILDSVNSSAIYSRQHLVGPSEINQFVMPASGKVFVTAQLQTEGDDGASATVSVSNSIGGLGGAFNQFTLNSLNSIFPFLN